MFLRIARVLGAITSLTCALHCLAMPLLLSLGATFLTGHAIVHLFILLAFIAVRSAAQQAPRSLGIAMWGAWALFTVGIVLEHVHVLFAYLGIGASLLLAALHVLNHRRRARSAQALTV